MNRLVIGLAIAFMVIAGMNLTTRPLESATPAIVNPVGWDKPTIWKHLDEIIKVCQDKNVTWVMIVNKINTKVCDLPDGIWANISKYAWDGYKQDPALTSKLIEITCENWKRSLGWSGAK